jgi:hypothetical protein
MEHFFLLKDSVTMYYASRNRTPTPLPLLAGINSMPASSRARRFNSSFAKASLAGRRIDFAIGLDRLPYPRKSSAIARGAFDVRDFGFTSFHRNHSWNERKFFHTGKGKEACELSLAGCITTFIPTKNIYFGVFCSQMIP